MALAASAAAASTLSATRAELLPATESMVGQFFAGMLQLHDVIREQDGRLRRIEQHVIKGGTGGGGGGGGAPSSAGAGGDLGLRVSGSGGFRGDDAVFSANVRVGALGVDVRGELRADGRVVLAGSGGLDLTGGGDDDMDLSKRRREGSAGASDSGALLFR